MAVPDRAFVPDTWRAGLGHPFMTRSSLSLTFPPVTEKVKRAIERAFYSAC